MIMLPLARTVVCKLFLTSARRSASRDATSSSVQAYPSRSAPQNSATVSVSASRNSFPTLVHRSSRGSSRRRPRGLPSWLRTFSRNACCRRARCSRRFSSSTSAISSSRRDCSLPYRQPPGLPRRRAISAWSAKPPRASFRRRATSAAKCGAGAGSAGRTWSSEVRKAARASSRWAARCLTYRFSAAAIILSSSTPSLRSAISRL
mmetsp:Transcript_2341/g.6532  ORF Transcript_2341/g.6532 Transcript_2341/m.6532 type:complete len:205 (-) Transcript_2341:1107-1721(-)